MPDPAADCRTAYLGLGSNEGDREAHLQGAVDRLHATAGVRVTGASPVYESEAHTLGKETQPPYLNAVLRVATTRSPDALLEAAHEAERAEGRRREAGRRWRPRPLDVDLLVVGAVTRDDETLVLPHPRLAERRFVLRPLADLAPNLVLPAPLNEAVCALLEQCPDRGALAEVAFALSLPGSNRFDA